MSNLVVDLVSDTGAHAHTHILCGADARVLENVLRAVVAASRLPWLCVNKRTLFDRRVFVIPCNLAIIRFSRSEVDAEPLIGASASAPRDNIVTPRTHFILPVTKMC